MHHTAVSPPHPAADERRVPRAWLWPQHPALLPLTLCFWVFPNPGLPTGLPFVTSAPLSLLNALVEYRGLRPCGSCSLTSGPSSAAAAGLFCPERLDLLGFLWALLPAGDPAVLSGFSHYLCAGDPQCFACLTFPTASPHLPGIFLIHFKVNDFLWDLLPSPTDVHTLSASGYWTVTISRIRQTQRSGV